MINTKIDQLRLHLVASGVSNNEADQIIQSILRTAQDKIQNILANNIGTVSQRAEEMRAFGFLDQISLKVSHNGLEISTDSGSTDFSQPEFPMLDRLLARGRTAKDGSTYRVIPIGKGGPQKATTVKDVSNGLATIDSSKAKPTSLTEMVGNMAASFGMGASKISRTPKASSSNTQAPTFRVASSKQDRNSSWVIPKRDADMTPIINEVNATMGVDIDNAVTQAISEHREEIEYAIRDARDSRN